MIFNDYVGTCILPVPGAPEVLDHYHKASRLVSAHQKSFLAQWGAFCCNASQVKEGLAKELAMRGILRHKTMDVPDVDLLSTLSTIAAWTSSIPALTPRSPMWRSARQQPTIDVPSRLATLIPMSTPSSHWNSNGREA